MANGLNQSFYFSLRHKTMDVELQKDQLRMFTISESIFSIVPRFYLELSDAYNFSEDIPICDGDVLTVNVATQEKSDNYIGCDLWISDHHIIPTHETQSKTTSMSGYIDLTDIYFPHKNRSITGPSLEVLKKISKELGVEFKTNIEKSDNMCWIQNSNTHDFIQHIMDHSYITDDAVFAYVDVYGTLNFKSIFNSFGDSVKYQAVYDIEKSQRSFEYVEECKTNLFYRNYDLSQINGELKRRAGYGVNAYNYNGSVSESSVISIKNKMSEVFNIHDKIKPSDNSQKIILPKNDTDNHHERYHSSKIQNMIYKNDLLMNSITLNVSPESPVKLMDKILLKIPTTKDETKINDVLSGEYLVTDIIHTVSMGGLYEKQILICRSGIDLSDMRRKGKHVK